jgi:mycofactocin system glycosyltransferase
VNGLPAVGTPPPDRTPPPGTTLVLDRHVVALDGGTALLGGAPPRLLRLAPAGRALLATGRFAVADATSAAFGRRLLDAGVAHPLPAGHTGEGPGPADVTVVIPVKDRAPAVTRLLAALPPGLGGVIVVDDGSADPGALRAAAGNAVVLRHDRPRGPAAARNAGLAAATTPLVAFLDSDVLPEPGWLAPLLGHLADPVIGLVAPRIVALPPVSGWSASRWSALPSPSGWLARYEAVRSSLDLGPDPAAVVPRSRVAYVPSAVLLVRRAAVGGGFDERMHVAEDVDLVLRLHAAGWRLRYEPASRVAHEHRTDPGAWWLRKAYYGSGAAPLALRHRGAVPPLVLTPWSAAAVGLLLARRPLAALAVVAGSAERLARQLPGPQPRRTAARIVALGAVGAAAQTADAITRHYWPLAALACAVSRRARRVVAAVAVVEGLVDWHRHRRWDARVRPGPLGHVAAHRLDDLAYGTGLWWGALRHRTLAPLRPAGPRFASGTGGQTARDDEREGSTMTAADPTEGAEVPDAAGMPHLDPPAGGMNEDPDSPDAVDLMPPRPGPSPAESGPETA